MANECVGFEDGAAKQHRMLRAYVTNTAWKFRLMVYALQRVHAIFPDKFGDLWPKF